MSNYRIDYQFDSLEALDDEDQDEKILRFYLPNYSSEYPLFLIYTSGTEVRFEGDISMRVIHSLIDQKAIPSAVRENEIKKLVMDALKPYLTGHASWKEVEEELEDLKHKETLLPIHLFLGKPDRFYRHYNIQPGDPREASLYTDWLIEQGDNNLVTFDSNIDSYREHALKYERVLMAKNTLLIGAISSTSEREYREFVREVLGKQARPLVVDINRDTITTYDKVGVANSSQASGQDLPLANNSIDVVFTNHLIHMLKTTPESRVSEQSEQITDLLTGVYRVLKIEGMVSMQEMFDGNVRKMGFSTLQDFADFLASSMQAIGFRDVVITSSKRRIRRDIQRSTIDPKSLSICARK